VQLVPIGGQNAYFSVVLGVDEFDFFVIDDFVERINVLRVTSRGHQVTFVNFCTHQIVFVKIRPDNVDVFGGLTQRARKVHCWRTASAGNKNSFHHFP